MTIDVYDNGYSISATAYADGDRLPVRIHKTSSFGTQEWAPAEISWGGPAGVSPDHAEKFLECVQRCVAVARWLDDELTAPANGKSQITAEQVKAIFEDEVEWPANPVSGAR